MVPDDLMIWWQNFAANQDFQLNPDREFVKKIAEAVLVNEKNTGLKLCPCRLRDGTRSGDLALICPCNFKAQPNYKAMGHCWCGLYQKIS